MDKKTTGFAIMFLSLILMIGFQIVGWKYIGDFSLEWPEVWMLTAIAGFILAVWNKTKD